MATLGIVLLWGGYTIGIFGFAKIKSAYGLSPTLSVSDLALPSHRNTYLAAAQAWGSGSTAAASSTGTGSSNSNSSGGVGSTTVGAGSPPNPAAAAYTNPFGAR